MKCENCGNEHDGSYGSGRFCSSKCARGYSRKNDKGGTKIVQCIDCGKEIKVDKRASSKKCKCDECRGYYKQTKGKCINCGKNLVKSQRKYCSQKCQNDYQYKEYIRKWKNGEVSGMRGRGGISKYIRRYMMEKYSNKCFRCGWCEVNPVTNRVPLEIEHIDGNYKNNKEKNLALICPNCHSLTSTYKALNKGNGREYRYLLK